LYHNIPQESKPRNVVLSTTLEKFNIGSNCSSFRLIQFFFTHWQFYYLDRKYCLHSPIIIWTEMYSVYSNRNLIFLTCILKSDTTCVKWITRGADESLARPGRKQALKYVRDAHDFNNIETRAVKNFFFFFKAKRRRKFTPFWQKETLACFLPGRAKDLSATLYHDDGP